MTYSERVESLAADHLAYKCKRWNESTWPQKGFDPNLLCTLLLPYRVIWSLGGSTRTCTTTGAQTHCTFVLPILFTQALSISDSAQHKPCCYCCNGAPLISYIRLPSTVCYAVREQDMVGEKGLLYSLPLLWQHALVFSFYEGGAGGLWK